MCSASQDDLRDHYETGTASTFMLAGTPAWQPDESSYDLSNNLPKQFDPSNTSSNPYAGLFNEPYPWADDDEKEDAVKDELYLSDTSHNLNSGNIGPVDFTGASASASASAMEPPPLVHESSSSSNPDTRGYTQDPRTPTMLSSAPSVYTKREDTESYEAEDFQEEQKPGRKNRTLTYRERNRIAAHKCRQKNKQSIQELQEQEHDLAQKNRVLAAHVGQLKDEVLALKSEILNHGNCEDELIQNYIAKSAKSFRS